MSDTRRTNLALRELVVLGNHLCIWAGRKPVPMNHAEVAELANLLTAWDNALTRLREDRKEIEHISL